MQLCLHLLVGWARKLEVYAYQNGELVHLGNTYNPNHPAFIPTAALAQARAAVRSLRSMRKTSCKSPREVRMSYLASDRQSTYPVNDHAVSEEEYSSSVDLYFNDKTRIPLRAIP